MDHHTGMGFESSPFLFAHSLIIRGVSSRTGRSPSARREESPNSAEQCAG